MSAFLVALTSRFCYDVDMIHQCDLCGRFTQKRSPFRVNVCNGKKGKCAQELKARRAMAREVGEQLGFWLLAMVSEPSKCWVWLGRRNQRGYGFVMEDGRSVGAHRKAWSLINGSIEQGVRIAHLCGRSVCVNPWHLIEQHRLKGRPQIRGSNNGEAKLSTEQVREIRQKVKGKHWGIKKRLAREYGISASQLGAIISRRSWAWLDPEPELEPEG